MKNDFKIVFDQIENLGEKGGAEQNIIIEVELIKDELQEIDELRRLAMDISEPEQKSYTIT